jgi:hypothetical protein
MTDFSDTAPDAPDGAIFRGCDCLEDGTDAVMVFSVPAGDEPNEETAQFALRNQPVSHQVIGDGSPYVDDELARAKAEAQAAENQRAADAAPRNQKLLEQYERPSAGPAYPFRP